MEDRTEILVKITHHIFFLMVNLINDVHLKHSEFLYFVKKITLSASAVTKEKNNNIFSSDNVTTCNEMKWLHLFWIDTDEWKWSIYYKATLSFLNYVLIFFGLVIVQWSYYLNVHVWEIQRLLNRSVQIYIVFMLLTLCFPKCFQTMSCCRVWPWIKWAWFIMQCRDYSWQFGIRFS